MPSSGFRRVAVLGVTSLGTWAIYTVGSQDADVAAADRPSSRPAEARVVELRPQATPSFATARYERRDRG